MARSVKDIIINACARINLCSRRQALPGNITEEALLSLKGIAGEYSKNNLLQFLRRDIVIPHESIHPVTIIGTIDPEIENDTVDVECPNIAKINDIYKISTEESESRLSYVSLEDFYSSDFGNNVYTCQPISDCKFEVRLKNSMIQSLTSGIRLMYNVSYDIDLDGVLRIPDIYVELFETALAYKLAVKYPRLTEEQTNRLKAELTSIEDSVKAPTRASKLITYGTGARRQLTKAELLSGSFLGI